MDVLSRLLEINHEVRGIKIGRDTSAIHNLLYADDLLLAGKAGLENARAMWGCLDQFCQWSG